MNTKATKTTFNSIEEMHQHIGQEIGLSQWHEVNQASINQFATLTKDEQWIHTDPDRCAQQSPFKKPIAHGFYALSLFSFFLEDCVELKGAKMGMNYGFEKIRFTNIVPVGAKIRGRFLLKDLENRENGVKLRYQVSVEIEGEEKPAVVAEWIGLAFV